MTFVFDNYNCDKNKNLFKKINNSKNYDNCNYLEKNTHVTTLLILISIENMKIIIITFVTTICGFVCVFGLCGQGVCGCGSSVWCVCGVCVVWCVSGWCFVFVWLLCFVFVICFSV